MPAYGYIFGRIVDEFAKQETGQISIEALLSNVRGWASWLAVIGAGQLSTLANTHAYSLRHDVMWLLFVWFAYHVCESTNRSDPSRLFQGRTIPAPFCVICLSVGDSQSKHGLV